MSNSTDLAPQSAAAVSAQQVYPATPMGLMQLALQKESNIDVIERLAALQREEREYQAKVDFEEALNRCQSKLTPIARDMENTQTRSKYASFKALDKAVRPIYTEEGFSVSYGEAEESKADCIVMLAYLSRSGHTRVYRKTMPVSTKGPRGNDVMTPTHASGSAGSYAKRYLLKDIFNLSEGEGDDDGNGGLPDWLLSHLDGIDTAEDADILRGCFQAAYNEARTQGDRKAMGEIMFRRDRRAAFLKGGAQ